MLSKFKVQRYKSLFDTEIELEPLTVFIGPNGSGKSNICEALAVLSDFWGRIITNKVNTDIRAFFLESLKNSNQEKLSVSSKLWHGETDYLFFEISAFKKRDIQFEKDKKCLNLSIYLNLIPLNNYHSTDSEFVVNIGELEERTSGIKVATTTPLQDFLFSNHCVDTPLATSLKKVDVYDFFPMDLSTKTSSTNNNMDRTGKGITNSLVDILHENRDNFAELEERLTRLVPNIKRISLPRGENQTFELKLIDKYSDHHIPATEISDGTLRILAFLTAIYQKDTPSIICFEELENGVHPWLLHKLVELLQIVATEGISGKPVQVLITTHSPLLLNYVKPEQVRAVELDKEGKTQVHKLPTDSVRFQKALEAYDNDLGELWFTNVFGGNPQ
jgi:predicted ATPase